MSASSLLASVGVAGSSSLLAAPASAGWDAAPTHAAVPARGSIPHGRINRQDLDVIRESWLAARAQGRVCGNAVEGDANGDGCTDIVDVQALLAAQGHRTVDSVVATPGGKTYTVTSAADTADVAPGNGICADALGQCTLRAAMAEADYIKGDDRIEFNLPGLAPQTIQLTSMLPIITARNGTVTIDGYTQPGSQVNTATVGSNAIPGVEIRGNGSNAKEVGFRVTSAGNTIRGLVIGNIWRGIFLDGSGAHDNLIIGNWIGYKKDGTTPSSTGQYGIILNTGSFNNIVGTPDLADRNVVGNWHWRH